MRIILEQSTNNVFGTITVKRAKTQDTTELQSKSEHPPCGLNL